MRASRRNAISSGVVAIVVAVLLTSCGSGVTGGTGSASRKGSYPPIPAGTVKLGALYSLTGPIGAVGANLQAQEKALVSRANLPALAG